MSHRILIVEDSRTQAAALTAHLANAGYFVTHAVDGDAGLKTVESGTFDLVISDVVMPGEVDGYALCRAIKDRYAETPVMLLTGLSDPMDVIRGLEAGADNFLTKPYETKYLLERVNALLRTRSARSGDRLGLGVKVLFMGREFHVTAAREQILDMLVTTFEEAVRQNRDLRKREEELTEAQTRLAKYTRSLEARLERLADAVPDVLYSVTPDWKGFMYFSRACESVFDLAPEAFSREEWESRLHPDDRSWVIADLESVVRDGEQRSVEYRYSTATGHPRWIHQTAIPTTNGGGKVARIDGIARDVTLRREAEESILRQADYLRLLQAVTAAAADADELDDALRVVVAEVCRRTAWVVGHAYQVTEGGESLESTDVWHPEEGGSFADLRRATEAHRIGCGEGLIGRAAVSGRPEWIPDLSDPDRFLRAAAPGDLGVRSAVAVPVHVRGEPVAVLEFFSAEPTEPDEVVLDVMAQIGTQLGRVAERRRARQDRESIEAQVRQAQKMEAVGRLAGGVAHDFNNLLTVILTEAQLLRQGGPSLSVAELAESIDEIEAAGKRAAALTRQLLTFSRRDVTEAEVLDSTEIVASLRGMLRRLIGETIRLDTRFDDDVGAVRIDRGHLEQVVVNLAVNARDAMPDGGGISIEVQDVDLDATYAELHPHCEPGPYVMIAVSDSGTGMSEEVQGRIFEPFFTTKAVGKGTGLGLATSYGIVRDAGGHIGVYSEVGVGTTMKVYLPRVDARSEEAGSSTEHEELAGGGETILVVEDEASVRRIAVRALEAIGYEVLSAASGDEALTLLERADLSVHLLFTDLVMPGMSGKEIAERARALVPGIRVLYTSGYTNDVALRHELTDGDVAVVTKPFTPHELSRKVRAVLDEEAGG